MDECGMFQYGVARLSEALLERLDQGAVSKNAGGQVIERRASCEMRVEGLVPIIETITGGSRSIIGYWDARLRLALTQLC
jgi:hypothetical protein